MDSREQRAAVRTPEVLLPKKGTDLGKWAVVACDQFTSEPQYWEEARRLVSGAPSTLNLIFPEVYLEAGDADARIADINAKMREYLEDGTLTKAHEGIIITERVTVSGEKRRGLMLAFDLEEYDYSEGAKPLIRASEGTITSRIPPRLKIREHASIELPHILMLIDDAKCSVIEPLFAYADVGTQIYDTKLMLGGGRQRGWCVKGSAARSGMLDALCALRDKAQARAPGAPFLYAVGDGNHSLATAKAHWERVKAGLTASQQTSHPARFALCELVNVYDPGFLLHAIHRVIYGREPERMIEDIVKSFETLGIKARVLPVGADVIRGQWAYFAHEHGEGVLHLVDPPEDIVHANVQAGLDEYLSTHDDATIDYIHGEDTADELAKTPGALVIQLPFIKKRKLFETVERRGVLPRKSFSIGEAQEKRYYMEAKRIVVE